MPAFQYRLKALSAAIVVLASTSTGALAQKKYDTGAIDTEITSLGLSAVSQQKSPAECTARCGTHS